MAAVAVAGLVLRWSNVDFDQGKHLHPDERHWSLTAAAMEAEPRPAPHGTVLGPALDWFDGQRSPANAYRGSETFVYGGLPLAVARGAAGWLHRGASTGDEPAHTVVRALDGLGLPLLDDAGAPTFDAGYGVNLVGRLLSGLVDTLMVIVVALIGRRLAGPLAGVGAAVLAACSVMSIQHAHFMTSEAYLGLGAALVVLATLRLVSGAGTAGARSARAAASGAWAGAAAGATLAIKLSGAPVAVVPFLVATALLATRRQVADVARLAGMAVAFVVALRVLHPAGFQGLGLRPSGYWDDVRAAQELARADLPPSIQWAGRSVLEPLRWLLELTVGPGTVLAAAIGGVHLWRRRAEVGRLTTTTMLASVALPPVVVLPQLVKSGRYLVPMLPALFACGGVGLVVLVRAARTTPSPRRARAATAAAVAVVATSALWAIALVDGVYGHENTRIAASVWIAENVPAGATISNEAWDDALPLGVDGVDPGRYHLEQLDLFGPDTVEKVERLADQLQGLDVVVESSPRVWGSVTRLPARFPSTIRFFEGLDDGSLGFTRVATFTSPPRLGPLRLPSHRGEEAFSVYDHPEVRIWQRTEPRTTDEVLAALDVARAGTALPVAPAHGEANGSQLLPAERAAARSVGTYASDFADGPEWPHVLGWLLVLELLGLASFALLVPLLHRLPDAGAGLAKTAGLVLPAAAVFTLTTRAGITLSRGLVGGVVGGYLALGVGAAFRCRALIADVWRTRRRTLLQVEVLTLLAFGALLLLRAADPDLWHPYRSGEKPFEMEMLTAVLRTPTLPPYDPWFSGGALNYYYGGYLLLSVPARLLRTSPALVMNLAPAVLAAATVGAASSAGAALWSTSRRAALLADGRSLARRGRAVGLLAAGFVLLLPSSSIVPILYDRLVHGARGPIDWWSLSRTFPRSPIATEFPAWSFLFSDVHPHLLDFPLVLSAIALAVAVAQLLRHDTTRHAVAGAAVAGVLVGATRAVNTWDLPLTGGLLALALLGGIALRAPRRRLGLAAAAAVAGAVITWGPYVRRSDVTDAGIELETLRSPLRSWSLHHGFFATLTVLLVVAALLRLPTPAGRRAWYGLGGVLLAPVLLGAWAGRAPLGMSVALAGATAWAASTRRGRDDAPGPLPFLALALGWSVVAVVEVVSVVNDFDRMNTVFKSWLQAWMLLAVGSAALVVDLWSPPPPHRGRLRSLPGRLAVACGGVRIATGAAAVLAVAFATLAVPARLEDRISTGGLRLDGLAYLDAGLQVGAPTAYDPGDDRALIGWLQRNVAGIVTVAERPAPDYQWNGRIAVHTGLPSIVSWGYHQSQQRRRYGAAVVQRGIDADALYASTDPVAITQVLQRYDVRYVVFGAPEVATVSPGARAALERHPCLDVRFRDGPRWVAAVDRACLTQQPGGLPVRAG